MDSNFFCKNECVYIIVFLDFVLVSCIKRVVVLSLKTNVHHLQFYETQSNLVLNSLMSMYLFFII